MENMKRVADASEMIYTLGLHKYLQEKDVAALVNHCFLSQEKADLELERVKQRKTHYNACQGSISGLIQATKAANTVNTFDATDLNETMNLFECVTKN